MLEAIVTALITGALTLLGVLISNSKSQAVMETKVEELTREVREHNGFARRMPVVEEQIKVINHRIADLERNEEKMKNMKKIIAVAMILAVVLGLSGCAALQDETVNAIANEAFTAAVKIVAQLVMAAFGIGLTWLTIKLGKTEKFKALTEVLGQLSATVSETVGELQQTIVEQMKAASADGKLTPDEITKLNIELLARVKSKMAQPAIDILVAAQVDINALILGMAESVINDMHKSRQTIPGVMC